MGIYFEHHPVLKHWVVWSDRGCGVFVLNCEVDRRAVRRPSFLFYYLVLDHMHVVDCRQRCKKKKVWKLECKNE